MKMQTAKRLRGRVAELPGDKSISHRAAILASLARGPVSIQNYSTSDDCASTLQCLAALGVRLRRDGRSVHLEGAGDRAGRWNFSAPAQALDCGNSGSTMRMLAGVLAAQGFSSTLTGDASLSRRPMRRIIEPLERMGARIHAEEGHAPLRIEGRAPLRPIEYEMPVASAQVKSCVLLAGLGAEGRTRIFEPRVPTRDHTERMLSWFGVEVGIETTDDGREHGRRAVSLEGPRGFAARDLAVPGDISAAAFLIAAAAMLRGSDLTIEGVGLNPTRTQFLDTLRLLGADVSVEDEREECNEPVGTLRVRGGDAGSLRSGDASQPFVLRGPIIAQLIDELPMLAVVGTQVEGGLEIREAGELRFKESDRIGTTVQNLRAMGAEVEEYEDGLKVHGAARLRGAQLDAHGDHRIAMAFTVAALVAEGESFIRGAEGCVGVSFPAFFRVLESVTESVEG